MPPSEQLPNSPQAVVLAALNARRAGDWRLVASLAEPQSLERWRVHWVACNSGVPSLAELARDHPDASQRSLEALISQIFLPRRKSFEANLPRLVGVDTLAALAALPSSEVLARYLDLRDPASCLARLAVVAYAEVGKPLPAHLARSAVGPVEDHVLTQVESLGPSRVRVTVRARHAEAGSVEQASTTWVLERGAQGEWRILVDEQFLDPAADVRAWIVDDPVVAGYMASAQQGPTRRPN
jgi:hypothetical protein